MAETQHNELHRDIAESKGDKTGTESIMSALLENLYTQQESNEELKVESEITSSSFSGEKEGLIG